MTNTGKLCTALACAALGTAALPASAAAEETDCVGTIVAPTVDNLRVPEDVTGDIQLDQNEGAPQRVADNDVNGSVQVMKNVGGVDISTNIIDGNLQCKENDPAPTGGGNEVQGNAEDQCALLAGGSPEAGPGGDGAMVVASSLRASQRGVVRVPLRCAASSRCTGRVRLVARGSRVARAAASGGTRFAIAA